MVNVLGHIQIGQKTWLRSADTLKRLNNARIMALGHHIRTGIILHPPRRGHQRHLDREYSLFGEQLTNGGRSDFWIFFSSFCFDSYKRVGVVYKGSKIIHTLGRNLPAVHGYACTILHGFWSSAPLKC